MPKSRILVIDDEAAIRDSLKMTLEYEGYEFIGAATGQEGLALAEREAPDLVLLDVKMPGMDGIEVLERLRNMNEALPVVVVSGHGTISTAVEATKKGAFDFIEKPFASERVLVSLRNALDSRQLRDEVRTLKKAVEVRHQMIGDSAGLKQVHGRRSDAARRPTPPCSSPARAASARSWSRGPSTATACAAASASCRSTARRFPRS
jgi:DNA-binding NtrC family response regulator